MITRRQDMAAAIDRMGKKQREPTWSTEICQNHHDNLPNTLFCNGISYHVIDYELMHFGYHIDAQNLSAEPLEMAKFGR